MSRGLALAFLAAALLLTAGCKKKQEAADNGFRVGYATEGVTLVDDPDAARKASEELLAEGMKGMTLSYKNDAFSTDGITFDCYLANHPKNSYDMFVAIYGDEEYTDELYLSQLLRPGTAFNEIKLEHALEPGDHTVHAAYTLVEEVDGQQVMQNQQLVTMVFHVVG
jgi:hypothetical protein